MADESTHSLNEMRAGIRISTGRNNALRVSGLSLATDPVFRHVPENLRAFLRIDAQGAKHYDADAFRGEVTRMLRILQDPIELDRYCRDKGIRQSVYDPRLAAQWDSRYKQLYQLLIQLGNSGTVPGSAANGTYLFEGTAMHPMEVNYYFIGMLFKHMRTTETGMVGMIHAWKLKYEHGPSANDLSMARRGYRETTRRTQETPADKETDPVRMATHIIQEIEGTDGIIVDRAEEQAMLRLLERAAQAGTLDLLLNYLLSRGKIREAFNEISDNFRNTLRMVVTKYANKVFHQYLPG